MSVITTEGLNLAQRLLFKAASPPAGWYVAPFEGDYTPGPGLTAATFPSTATECTAYEGAARPQLVLGDVTAGLVNNYDDVIEFVMTAGKTIYGFALLSSSAKGGTGGVCYGAIRLATPKVMESGGLLRVRASAFAVSAA